MLPRKTKIICTIGPSTYGVENLTKLFKSGMDAARLNFSHGTHEEHLQTIQDIRKVSSQIGKHIAILQDLQGPKIRTGKVENGEVELEDNAQFIITVDDLEIGNSLKVATVYKNLIKEVKAGNTILLDDGYIILNVEAIKSNNNKTKIVKGGILKDNKGIIAPGVSSSAPSLDQKDLADLKFGLQNGVDAVALSFVRSERDVLELKTAMKIFGRTVPIIAKIERYEGFEDINDIILESDAIMVARGDLGLEMPAEKVPLLQKEIIQRCNYWGKPVIIATQMLESMIQNPRPTRAEASDVANAVLDGTDCVMLSGETSIGKYPFDAVDYMHRIIKVVEDKFICTTAFESKNEVRVVNEISDALGKASCVIAEQINAVAIVSLTSSGFTAGNIAKYRPQAPILALTNNEDAFRQLSFSRGVQVILLPEKCNPEDIFDDLGKYVENLDYINKDDYIVFVAGLSADKIMPENMIKVHRLS